MSRPANRVAFILHHEETKCARFERQLWLGRCSAFGGCCGLNDYRALIDFVGIVNQVEVVVFIQAKMR